MAIWIVGLVAGVVLAGGEALRLVLPTTPTDVVAVEGLSEGDLESLRRLGESRWSTALRLSVDSGDGLPQMLGSYRLASGRMSFTPRFPFQPGQRYRVELAIGELRATETFLLELSEAASTTRVTGIDPALAEVPENLLRFYIHFSAPMRGGDVYRHVRLLDERGEPIELAFVEAEPELWDRDRRRLTLISHPGRIKQSLEMRQRQGPTLREGYGFRLVVDAAMLDAGGTPLVESFDRGFSVTAADRRSPVVANWVVHAPDAGIQPLWIEFDEPLDPALLHRLIAVETAAGEPVPGHVELEPGGRTWSYLPVSAWAAGNYSVLVHPSLEDLAGNRLDRPFDVAGEGAAEAEQTAPIRLGFTVRR